MPNHKDKVVIDTIWISFLLSKNNSKLEDLLSEKLIVLLFREELVNEFTEVAKRPKFKKYFSLLDLQLLLTHIEVSGLFIKVTR